jgi:hypothetical protein
MVAADAAQFAVLLYRALNPFEALDGFLQRDRLAVRPLRHFSFERQPYCLTQLIAGGV